MYAIEVENLAYRYPEGQTAIEEVTFRVSEGERVALAGANGAGKSTLIWCLGGLVEPCTGQIRILGEPLTHQSQALARRYVGILFQDPDDQLFMPTVVEDVSFGLWNRGVPWHAAIAQAEKWLRKVGMSDAAHRHPHHLSIGERKRVAIAGVLAVEPKILALDEPTSGLDPRARRGLIRLLAPLPCTLILATHDLDLARSLCPRTLLLHQGRLVADGPTADLLGDEALLEANGL
ncbi:MAG: energy-coupling factor ABC transporter ATP-binding protein [Chthonomonadales bacterium]